MRVVGLRSLVVGVVVVVVVGGEEDLGGVGEAADLVGGLDPVIALLPSYYP